MKFELMQGAPVIVNAALWLVVGFAFIVALFIFTMISIMVVDTSLHGLYWSAQRRWPALTRERFNAWAGVVTVGIWIVCSIIGIIDNSIAWSITGAFFLLMVLR